MNFVLLAQSDMNDQDAIKDLAKAPGGLVLMFTDAKEEDKVRVPKEFLPKEMYRKIKLKRKNTAIITNTICHQITHKLDQFTQHPGVVSEHLKLADCAESARMIGIHVDEDVQECKEGKRLATALVAKITSLDTNPDSTTMVKDRMLPLQGPNLWQAWTEHDKEQHRHINRGSRSIEQYNSEKEKEKIAATHCQKLLP